jgi:membrane associated rhomboid family serine protease
MTGSSGAPGEPPTSGSPGSSVPTCYRHPDRETYIRCSRCERYICPDCMTAAPVGFQCPECVAEGRKSVRQATTLLGGEVRERGDLLTKVLIGINVVVWAIGAMLGASSLVPSWSRVTADFGLVLGSAQDRVEFGVVDGQWYRLITAAFVHEEIWHLGLNMFALWILGRSLEPVLGRWRFLAIYLLSALGGTAASLLTAGPYAVSIGASGAVFGLMGALLIILRRFGRDVSAVLALLGINVVYGFIVPGIDWRAHLGGLVVGAVLAFVFAHAPRSHRTVWSVVACVVTLAVTLGTVLTQVA